MKKRGLFGGWKRPNEVKRGGKTIKKVPFGKWGRRTTAVPDDAGDQ